MDFLFRWPCGTTMPPCLRCDHSPAPGHTCIRDWFGRPYRWPLPLLEPAERFRVVLTHPLTLKKKNSEIVVRARKTLFGRCPQPAQRCPVVRGVPQPLAYITARLTSAGAYPRCAACSNHFSAFFSPQSGPIARMEAIPNWFCSKACPRLFLDFVQFSDFPIGRFVPERALETL